MKILKKIGVSILIAVLLLNMNIPSAKAEDSMIKYGIVVGDDKNTFSFYDLNTTTGAGIEITESGNVMVPIKKLCDLMKDITLTNDKKTQKLTVKNLNNGKSVVFTKESAYVVYYKNDKDKGTKKKMPYKTYVSEKTKATMVHMSALKWIMDTTTGVKSFKVNDMQSAGYDTSVYSGLIVYNPYSSVSLIPKATEVNNISKTVKVTIPEGYSVPQIFNLLVKKGVCASTDFLYDAMENYDFSYYPLVSEIEDNTNRSYKLEGYLYPDTYEFYRLSKGADVIGKFLRNTENHITDDARLKAKSMGYSVNELLTIASLIEKEAGDKKYMADVSTVIHNRLNKGMQLQLDASIYYVERYIKPYITGDVNRYNNYYNTYKCEALPAGPICNPGKEAINAALNPLDNDNLYFYSDEQGNYYFTPEYVPVVSNEE